VSICVFTGPTISAAEARDELEATYFPPAAEGDVYRAALRRPQAIGIIDGYFQDVPSVRHKEILWAMSRGIHVFGSASIGALRAAELAAFGMEGVGKVFESYRAEILEDDDEVAIAHGPAEVEFWPLSEAMVNIRETLRSAELEQVISPDVGRSLEQIAKQLFYPERSYPVLLRRASESGLPEAELARLRAWLPESRVNQKREDAVAMLRLMRRRLAEGLEPKTVAFSFQHTAMWDSVLKQGSEHGTDPKIDPNMVTLESLLDELKVEGDRYKQHQLIALERFFAIRESDRLGMKVTDRSRKDAELAFRRERGFSDTVQVAEWMNENGMSAGEFDALMIEEARVRWVHQRVQHVTGSCLPDQLRLSGDYVRLLARAAKKERLLESFGFKNPSLKAAELTEDQLFRWYFEEVLGKPVPPDPDTFAASFGFADPHAFRRALLKEYLYRRLEQASANGNG
jgi:hypothetical protein